VIEWPPLKQILYKQKNIENGSRKTVLPPLCVKIEPLKNSVKAMKQNAEGFPYLHQKFPWVRDAK
jgi:hypothetical protein